MNKLDEFAEAIGFEKCISTIPGDVWTSKCRTISRIRMQEIYNEARRIIKKGRKKK